METVPILAIDPGREKCGVAAIERDGNLLWCEILPRAELKTRLQVLAAPAIVVVGNATASREIVAILGEIWPQLEAQIIDERGSTLEARDEYWRHHPPRGWRRLLPLSAANAAAPDRRLRRAGYRAALVAIMRTQCGEQLVTLWRALWQSERKFENFKPNYE